MSEHTEFAKDIRSTALEIARIEKQETVVRVLENATISIEQTHYDNWNNGTFYFTIFLTLDVPTYVSIKAQQTDIEKDLYNRFMETIKAADEAVYNGVSILPKAGQKLLEDNPHRPLSAAELERKSQLASYLDKVSEDDLIGEVLMPLFRYLGFQRITVAGHKDKALEYGKDIWMKFVLPTQNILYFGVQVKKGKLDSSGQSKTGNANVAEILNQVTMMLGHEIFDPETSRRVLVDHAFIVAAGEITKPARNWLAGKLDASKRSQIMFIEREDILNLYIVNNIALPLNAYPPQPPAGEDDGLPF
ncbi:hypothetical protein [Pedobacter sp.]|uniref:hypothetical protein n=1 Tax=Pedobacter sp. TaxID=1411316 RepID=UPI003C5E5803